MSAIASRLLLLLVLLALPSLPDARVVPLLAILRGSRQFRSLRKLVTEASIEAVAHYLKSSSDGLTIFAPNNDAFGKLPNGTLSSLTTEEKTRLFLLHVVPQYLSYDALYRVTNPLPTLASNLTLNVTVIENLVNVSAGLGSSRVISSYYMVFPLAVYLVDQVLTPANSAPAPGPASP